MHDSLGYFINMPEEHVWNLKNLITSTVKRDCRTNAMLNPGAEAAVEPTQQNKNMLNLRQTEIYGFGIF